MSGFFLIELQKDERAFSGVWAYRQEAIHDTWESAAAQAVVGDIQGEISHDDYSASVETEDYYDIWVQGETRTFKARILYLTPRGE